MFERSALPQPTALDDLKGFHAFLDAVRWGATSNAARDCRRRVKTEHSAPVEI